MSILKKKCWDCGKTKPQSYFYKNKANWDGLDTACKDCKRKIVSSYRNKNRKQININRKILHQKDKTKKKHHELKWHYGISYEQFKAMLIAQNFRCAISNHKINDSTANVDHCHKTGKIRGLLCRKCNFGLGQFEDSVLILNKAVKYLTKGTKWANKNLKNRKVISKRKK